MNIIVFGIVVLAALFFGAIAGWFVGDRRARAEMGVLLTNICDGADDVFSQRIAELEQREVKAKAGAAWPN